MFKWLYHFVVLSGEVNRMKQGLCLIC